jgi:hypothetical protein
VVLSLKLLSGMDLRVENGPPAGALAAAHSGWQAEVHGVPVGPGPTGSQLGAMGMLCAVMR